MTDSHDDNLLEKLGERARETQRRDALRPLGEDFNARMVQQIKKSVADSDTEEDLGPARSRRVVHRGWLALAASAVAAVGLSFIMLTRDALPPLPGYELSLSGGATLRSDEVSAPLQIGDTLSAVLRPNIDTDAKLDVRVFRENAGDWVTVPAIVDISNTGAARVRVRLDEAIGIEPGAQDWWFVIGHRDALPSAMQFEAGAPTSNDQWSAFRTRFELVP